MARTYELRDLRIKKISLVRKSHRPVHQDAVIQVVKSQEENAAAAPLRKADVEAALVEIAAARGLTVTSTEGLASLDAMEAELHDAIRSRGVR